MYRHCIFRPDSVYKLSCLYRIGSERATCGNESNVALHLLVVWSNVCIACDVNASVVGTVDDISKPPVGLRVKWLADIVRKKSLESHDKDFNENIDNNRRSLWNTLRIRKTTQSVNKIDHIFSTSERKNVAIIDLTFWSVCDMMQTYKFKLYPNICSVYIKHIPKIGMRHRKEWRIHEETIFQLSDCCGHAVHLGSAH